MLFFFCLIRGCRLLQNEKQTLILPRQLPHNLKFYPMDIKKLIIGTIAGAIVFFLLGWLFYDKLLVDFFRHNPGQVGLIGRKQPEFLYLVIGQVIYGLLLTYILLRANVSSLGGGLITGAITGFLICAAVDFTMYGTSIIMSKRGLAADVLAATVISAVAGAVIGSVVGGKKQ